MFLDYSPSSGMTGSHLTSSETAIHTVHAGSMTGEVNSNGLLVSQWSEDELTAFMQDYGAFVHYDDVAAACGARGFARALRWCVLPILMASLLVNGLLVTRCPVVPFPPSLAP